MVTFFFKKKDGDYRIGQTEVCFVFFLFLDAPKRRAGRGLICEVTIRAASIDE